MLIVTTTYTRPSASVSWFQPSSDFITFSENNYRHNGKILQRSTSISFDGLTKTVETTWATRDDYVGYRNDEQFIAMKDLRNAYNNEHGIISDTTRSLVGEAPPASE